MNKDDRVLYGFADEWSRFDQSLLTEAEAERMFASYFKIFPWETLPPDATGFDMGCGSGRWARFVAKRVNKLICVDGSSKTLDVAKKNLKDFSNIEFIEALVDACPIRENSMDFGYALGVLHHIPDTQEGISVCVQKLKPGAPFLIYLYYAFDNRPFWYFWLWKISEIFRAVISCFPARLRFFTTDVIAVLIYWPLSRLAHFCEKMNMNVKNFPLAAYRDSSFYTLRTDALDRFGTSLEKRYTLSQIREMMECAGLENIVFSSELPFWVGVGYKKK